MAQTCARCGIEAGDDARFCSACGAPLPRLQSGERKLATMVFADLVGSTQLATGLDPEELRARLTPFFDVARSTLEEHGGTVEKYVGDAVLAVFGVPVAHTDDPDRAVSAALELTRRVASVGDGLSVRVGVETGEVLALDRAGDLSVTGEAVNAAARLQQAAAPGEVLVGERTARAYRATALEERGHIEAKGFPEPLRTWRPTLDEPQGNGAAPRLIGRDDDLALLELVYKRAARDRVPELVTITGDAGVGKTRLASELTERLRALDPAPETLLGRNPPYGRGIAFWALGEIIREAAGADADDSVRRVHDLMAERLERLGADDAHELAAGLAAALGGEAPEGDVEDELKHAWRRLVAILAAERPLVIGIDDAHWADGGLLDLIEEVVFRLDDVPLMVVCTTRPELLERRPGFGLRARNVTQIELRPLTREAADVLAEALLPAEARALAPRVAEASGGNPFFAEEVVCAITEGRGDRLPDTVQAAIAARLDLLSATEKRTLQLASVLGTSFLHVALEELAGSPVDEELRALMAKTLIQERLQVGPGRYGFRHQLIRDVAYASLPRAERARLHERAAEGIVGRADERYAELVELVAYHRVQAAELDPAPARRATAHEATFEAAGLVFRRGASIRAQELYERAAELAASSADQIVALRAAATTAVRRFRGDEAVRLLQATAAVAEEADDPAAAAEAYARAVEIATRMSGITGLPVTEADLIAMLERGEELSDEADPSTRARLALDEAWLAWRFRAPLEMVAPAKRGLSLAREVGDPLLLSTALDAASASAWAELRHREGVKHTAERLRILADLPRGDPAVEVERSDALHMMVESLAQVGELERSLEYATKARELDLSRGVVYSGWSRAMVPAFLLGRWNEVIDMGRRVREAWTAMDRPPSAFMGGAIASAGGVLGYRGDLEAHDEWMDLAAEISGAGGQMLGVAIFRGDVALHRGDPEAAVSLLEVNFDNVSYFWWGPLYFATRAEAIVQAGSRRAAQALEEAHAAVGENPYPRAIVRRASGRLHGDESEVREALELFRRMKAPYQVARTAWLLGGEERAEAERAFAELGATLPGTQA
jgi:class 3 adenylate cyclase